MQIFSLFFEWYFTDLPKKIYQIWLNYLWFFKNYFSIEELLRSFFAPWKRIYFEKTTKGINLEEWFGNLTFNIFSRVIGMILRLFGIIIGILTELLTIIGGVLFLLLWLVFPFALIFCLVKGIQMI
jgi:hypothetical protein